MPDFAAHHLFGTQLDLPAAATKHPVLFNWGLQGPDPFFYRKVLQGSPLHATGSRLHEQATKQLLGTFAEYCGQCQGEAREMAEAYMYGFLGHYVLDSTVHPYVFWHQRRLSQLPKSNPSTIHCGIESDMDMDLYGYLLGKSPCTLDLAKGYLLTAAQEKAVGALYTHLLYTVYHLLVSPSEVAASFRDTYSLQRMLFSGNPMLWSVAKAVGKVQGKGGEHYASHFKGRQPRWDSLNLDGQSWQNPWTGEPHTQSVPQLMDQAAEQYQKLQSVLERNAAGARLPIPVMLDFSGKEAQA